MALEVYRDIGYSFPLPDPPSIVAVGAVLEEMIDTMVKRRVAEHGRPNLGIQALSHSLCRTQEPDEPEPQLRMVVVMIMQEVP